MHTEVNLWIIVDWHIDLLLCLGWAAIVLWRVVVRDDLYGLLDQLVAFILQLLSVSVLASVDTATKIVVLWRWGWRSSI